MSYSSFLHVFQFAKIRIIQIENSENPSKGNGIQQISFQTVDQYGLVMSYLGRVCTYILLPLWLPECRGQN